MPLLSERKEEYGPLPEKLLARLWQQRAARQREFRTGAGRRIRVLYPGRAGTAAGPDFRDALLEVEGLGVVQGDVELHRRQQDWYAHGHADDPNYNGVVLHAALETADQPTLLHNGQQAPVISLAALLEPEVGPPAPSGAPDAGGLLWRRLVEQGWPTPADAVSLGRLLDAAGDARFRAKAALFYAFNREQPPAQSLYQGLLEALGYRANRRPFLKLAQAAPWPRLAAEALARPPAQRAGLLEARLAQLAGWRPTGRNAAERPPGRRPAGYGRPMDAGEWHCFRVRPANHPRRRIAGAARLLARFLPETPSPGEGAGDTLALELQALTAWASPSRLTAALTVAADPGQRAAYVGAARAKDLAVNAVLPFCHALAGPAADSPALALYQRFGRLQENELTRELGRQLLGPDWPRAAATARRQQGLLHLGRQLAS